MKAHITVTMENAAFEDAPASELARILRELANKIERNGPDACKLRDINGNTVGKFVVTGSR